MKYGIQVFEARKGKPGHRRHLPPTGHAWNKHDEAYTANRAGRRGGRDSLNVDIAPKVPSRSVRVITHTETNTRASGRRVRTNAEATRKCEDVEDWRSSPEAVAGTKRHTQELGKPHILSCSQFLWARPDAEYPDRESVSYGVADQA